MKWAGLLVLAALALPANALDGPKVPDYFGFSYLNIPDFPWTEGAEATLTLVKLTGSLDMTHTSAPVFVSPDHDPVALDFNQTSRLLISPGSRGEFMILGFEVTAKTSDGTLRKFFVAEEAVIGGLEINLRPSLPMAPAPKKEEGRKRSETTPGPGPVP